MDHLARHVGDLLNEAVKHDSVLDLFKFIEEADDVSFAGRGTSGMAHFVRKGATRVVIKTVVMFPPEDDPKEWWSSDKNLAMVEVLLGTYYYSGKWKNGWAGEPIPRLEDRVGDQFAPKIDDPLPGLVDYTGFVILEQNEVGEYYEKMAEAVGRSGAPQAKIDILNESAKKVFETVRAGLIQRVFVMTLEAGDEGTFDKLARSDPDFPKYAVGALTQLLCTLYLLRTEDGFLHNDASTTNVVRKILPGTGPAHMRYRVQNDADGAVYLKVEHRDDFPLFMFIDFGNSSFSDRNIISIDELRKKALDSNRTREANLLSWVPEWRQPKVTLRADLHQSHAADKHLLGIDLITALAYRLDDKVDRTVAAVETIWAIMKFASARLLMPPAAIKDGQHVVPMFLNDDMKMDYKVVYGVFFDLVARAIGEKNIPLIRRAVSYEIEDYRLAGESMAKYSNKPDAAVSVSVRFFSPSAIANWDDFRPFWTDPLFDAVRTTEPRRGLKRGSVSLRREGSISATITPLLRGLPVNRPKAPSEKRFPTAHAEVWKGSEEPEIRFL